jgi:predicted phage terminase large subunit-like protein
MLSLNEEERAEVVEALSPEEQAAFLYNWNFWARPNQLPPKADWRIWLIMTGRGWGKNRTGAEYIKDLAQQGIAPRMGLIARTAGEVRETMVEGEAGVLTVSPPWFYPKYEPSKRRLTWPNGVIANTYSGDEPDQLRGPSHDFIWADELASWKYPAESWSNAMLGLRLGVAKSLITTTPRPLRLLKEIINKPGTALIKGTSYENFENLSEVYRENIGIYEGTRLGRQELEGELLEDVPGALWTLKLLDETRVSRVPEDVEMTRIVIGVDPAVTSSDESNETGIIVAGRGSNNQAYIFDDLSLRSSPDKWARVAVNAYSGNKADRVIAEVNNGGDLVEKTIRTVDPNISYKAVHASKGKVARAEPISALYEQHKVHHIGTFPELEDQMTTYVPGEADFSPDRMDALVWALTELMIMRRGTGGTTKKRFR